MRANRGAAGVDRVMLAAVEAYGVERMLEGLHADLRAGRYRDFFGSIDQDRLLSLVAERVPDRRVLKLVRQGVAS